MNDDLDLVLLETTENFGSEEWTIYEKDVSKSSRRAGFLTCEELYYLRISDHGPNAHESWSKGSGRGNPFRTIISAKLMIGW